MRSDEILPRILIPEAIGVPCARMNAGQKLIVVVMGANALRGPAA